MRTGSVVSEDSPSTTVLAPERRREVLARAVQGAAARRGRIESQSDLNATIVYGKPVNHILHLLLGFPTLGLWWIVWLILALTGGEKRELISVDEFGNVLVQKL